MKKILILRFSSIGDIVLTSPVIRCLKTQLKNVEIHYATKKSYFSILENNPYIDKIHLLEKELKPLISVLKNEDFDYIIDLHNNLRTQIIKFSLRKPSYAFKKLNFKKFLLTNFKINKMPDIHIVDRYLNTLKFLKVKNDDKGLDYFISKKDEINISDFGISKDYIGFVLGAKFATKRMPFKKILEICKELNKQVVFLGSSEDEILANKLIKNLSSSLFFNACGKFKLNQSASLVKQASIIITHDTGLMHIAAAYNKKIISIWGNTLPELGMYQYVSEENKIIVEVKDLACRPCSKIGYNSCPKKHFKCMNEIDVKKILKNIT